LIPHRDRPKKLLKIGLCQITAAALLERAQKVESLTNEIAAKLEKLHHLRDQGKI